MSRQALCYAVLLALLTRPTAYGQEGKILSDADQESGWTDQFDGKAVEGWLIEGLAVDNGDGTLEIGGAVETKLRLVAPIGKEFKIRMELRLQGSSRPLIRYARESRFSGSAGTSGLHGPTDRWSDYLLWNKEIGGQTALTMYYHEGRNSSGSAAISTGEAPLTTLEIVVPPGSSITLRKLRLQTTTESPPAPGGLAIAFGVLGAILVGIMALGWWLGRRAKGKPPQ